MAGASAGGEGGHKGTLLAAGRACTPLACARGGSVGYAAAMLVLALALGSSVATAGPVLVRVSSPQPPLEAPVALHEAGASWRLRDDGAAPDPQVGDGVWTGVAAATPGAAASLRLTDGAGRVWSGALPWPSGDIAELDLVLTDAGGLRAASASLQGGATPAGPPVGTATVPRSLSGSWAWAVAALGWGLALSVALRRRRRAPRALTAPTSPLGARRYTVPAGQGSAALEMLAQAHRVLVVGPPPVAPLGAAAFAPDSADPGDVAAALRDLDGRGRPLAVLVVAADASEAPGLAAAAAGLPVVFATDQPMAGARPLSLG